MFKNIKSKEGMPKGNLNDNAVILTWRRSCQVFGPWSQCFIQHLFLINSGIFFVVGGVDGDPCCVLANHVSLADTSEVGPNNMGVTFNHHPKEFFFSFKKLKSGVSVSKTHDPACSCQWNEICHKAVCSCCSLNATVLISVISFQYCFLSYEAVDADRITQVHKSHYLTSLWRNDSFKILPSKAEYLAT